MTRFVYDPTKGKVVPKHERAAAAQIHVQSDWPDYWSPMGDGVLVSGRRQAREHMAKHGKRLLEKGEEPARIAEQREKAWAESKAQEHKADSYGYRDSPGDFEVRFRRGV